MEAVATWIWDKIKVAVSYHLNIFLLQTVCEEIKSVNGTSGIAHSYKLNTEKVIWSIESLCL